MIFDHEFDHITILPRHSELTSRSEIDLSTDYGGGLLLSNPLISSPMSSVTDYEMAKEIAAYGGVGVIHRYMPHKAQLTAIHLLKRDGLKTMAAVSSKRCLDTAILCLSKVDGIMLDVAHGDTKACIDLIIDIKKTNPDIHITSGNIVTYDAASRLKDAGVNAFRVGIGAGHACITRMVSGIGRNQLKAIREVSKAGLPVLSCGGIRNSGDIVKCLAAGASGVIIGRLFSTTTESSAKRIGGKVVYAGMASPFAEDERASATGESRDAFHQSGVYEGETQFLEETGSLRYTVHSLLGGIRAGLAYLGCRSIKELHSIKDEIVWEDTFGNTYTY